MNPPPAAAGGATVLPRHERSRQTQAARVERYADQNRVCAEIILRERARYAGLPVIWAEAVIRGNAEHCRDWRLVA
jgi:hypothetical protein